MTTTNSPYSVENIQAQTKQFLAKLDKDLAQYKYANQAEALTGVRKSYMVMGVAGVMFIMIFFNLAGQLITNALSWLYPAYASFKAIETPGKEDDTQWLTYWTVIGFVQLIEYFSDMLLYWFPFYYLFKTIFVLWLTLPRFRGAQTLYHKLLRPQLIKLQSDIDREAHDLKDKVQNIANDVLGNKED
ncbi:TB2/DP1, HVA22 family-domain-containing protein [Gongronella butleri]|nr:TB2/DP1, HVA22 family-domain-containing protein [Gongronella butleri]